MNDTLITSLKKLDIVYREPVNLKNAGASDFYVDVKKAYGYPEALSIISDKLLEKIDKRATCIATAGYGGLSPATAISLIKGLKLVLVRDEPKKHGMGGWIDGYVPDENDKVAIFDDVLTTGGSLKKIIEVIKSTRAEVVGCYVVVKRGEAVLPFHVEHLLKPEDLV
jgi:orotate phosphoribosyltransferase